MSDREPEPPTADRPARPGRVRAYLRRFFTSWVAEDPDPSYSSLDRADGLGCPPVPPSSLAQATDPSEVAEHQHQPLSSAGRVRGRAGL